MGCAGHGRCNVSSANPLRLPEAWDFVILGGDLLPGLAKIEGARRPFKWDEKEGAGTIGASLTYRGERLVPSAIVLQFWLEEQIDEWDSVRPRLKPDARNVKALDIVHPSLEDLEVRSVVVDEIGALEHKGGGLFEVRISVKEYKPPPKANASGSPSGSSSSSKSKGGAAGTGNAPPSAKTEQEKEIERLLAEARKP
jgi:hypothetical protein